MDTKRIDLEPSQAQRDDTDIVSDLRAFGEQLMGMQFQDLMSGTSFTKHVCASYLADHLDGALELTETISSHLLGPNQETITEDHDHDGSWIVSGDAIFTRFAEIRTYVHELKTLELALTTRISQARIWAERVQRHDPRLERVAGLLLSGTHAFVDAGARQADTTAEDFNNSDPALVYLQSRGIVSTDVTSLDVVGALQPGYAFRIWGGISLFDVCEMMNMFLGAADVHYKLYEADDTEASASLKHDPKSLTETVTKDTDSEVEADSESGDTSVPLAPDVRPPEPSSVDENDANSSPT
jgi:hypothetical protein